MHLTHVGKKANEAEKETT